MEKKKKETDAWHDEPAHLDFISVHGPLRATEGIGADEEDSLEDAKNTLEIAPDNAEIWEDWSYEVSRRAGRTAFILGELLDEYERLRESVSA
jgi:hypothetical protein